jgi:hypothetical protein
MQALAVTRHGERRLQKLTRAGAVSGSGRVALHGRCRVEVPSLRGLVTYVVTRAEWRPLYDLRLLEAGDDDKGGPMLEVSYLGRSRRQPAKLENVNKRFPPPRR